jgi:glycosyltransferase involved in cell wall biosynthesis
MLSLVIPLYKNEEGLSRLLSELLKLQQGLGPEPLEVVFVVDGSPDRCYEILAEELPNLPLRAKLITLSRNFGSFAAIAAGLSRATGDIFAVLAADLQEPPELVIEFARILRSNQADVCFGLRAGRSDPWLSELTSGAFWRLYRRFVITDMPPGGVDIFGCNRIVRDRLLELPETNTNLIALLFWLGFRRKFVSYERRPRLEGRSAWTLSKKLKYSFDSIFNFTDLPIQWLLAAGFGTSLLAVVLGSVVLWGRLRGSIQVAGYTPIVLMIMFLAD